ncbi:ABC transporter substrate-binding protein [Clostridium malenominatum]|uniref:ABC transporter substrate-binding protein n=1 Tax=Clostridium malenominatum TaxID=1539 RepID=A0ABN1IXJ8_9CLOT
MVGKKTFKTIISMLLIGTTLFGCGASSTPVNTMGEKPKNKVKIGITQFIEHDALDSARKGFIEGLKSKGYEDGKNIEIDYQNSQGDMQIAQTIAQNFASKDKDLIFAIATPSAQAALNATKEIPIVITAVTDPVKSGLAQSMESSQNNVTGTSDAVSIKTQFELIKDLAPKAKSIGIIYNTSESNSEIQMEEAKNVSKEMNLNVIAAGVTNVNEINQAIDSILSKIDVLYVFTDNVVASSIPLLVDKCYNKGIPIIGSERGQVLSGALATVGIDYFKLGFQSALSAVEVINGKKPSEVPLSTLKEMTLSINEDAIKKLNINIPSSILDKSEKVKNEIK